MYEIIKVNYETEQPTVSARDLHDDWKLKRLLKTGFREWLNMVLKPERTFAQNERKYRRPSSS